MTEFLPATGARVAVVPVTPALRASVLALSCLPEQTQFSGQMPELLEAAEAAPGSEAMAVVSGEQVVGSYRLDFMPRAVAARNFGEPSAGLRGFFIDGQFQGRGLGRSAMEAMIEDLRRRHPAVRVLALSVNQRNLVARQLYLRSGFQDHGEAFLGGSAGPQDVMVRRL
ncbi:GNAT family N-acetyltransferase [Deinococcus sp. UYEF24]